MRRIITRLIIAQLIPLALRYGKKAFRKKKSAPQRQNTADNTAQTENSDT